jgi:hypothetical protein
MRHKSCTGCSLTDVERLTISLSDEQSADLSRRAAEARVSRARWVRELVIARLASLGVHDQYADHERRISQLEDRVF